MDVSDYWLGLDIKPVTAQSPTAWYDNNPSTYRADSNHDDATICIRYKNAGFRDKDCNKKLRYTCKKAATGILFVLSRILARSVMYCIITTC